jgi:hypothetical protein
VQRNSATVVALVGAVPEALRTVLGTHTTYALGDEDPLAPVADAWVRRFDEAGPVGELEVAVTATVARWRAGTVELPDYYLVTGVEDLTPTRRHWYFGVLHDASPRRIVPVDPDARRVLGALEALPPGPWWPPLDRLLAGIEHRVPDVVVASDGSPDAGGPGGPDGPRLLTPGP